MIKCSRENCTRMINPEARNVPSQKYGNMADICSTCRIKVDHQCEYVDENGDRCENLTGTHCCKKHARKFGKCKYERKNGQLCNKGVYTGDFCVAHSQKTRDYVREYRRHKLAIDKGDRIRRRYVPIEPIFI
jgi:hypothetical protein